jgi:hypothetical protein
MTEAFVKGAVRCMRCGGPYVSVLENDHNCEEYFDSIRKPPIKDAQKSNRVSPLTTKRCDECGAGYDSHEAHRCNPEGEKIHHPKHYNTHPSGVECIDITEHMGFNIGNAIKYIWRADEKGKDIEDLQKARWYIEREISKRMRESNG